MYEPIHFYIYKYLFKCLYFILFNQQNEDYNFNTSGDKLWYNGFTEIS